MTHLDTSLVPKLNFTHIQKCQAGTSFISRSLCSFPLFAVYHSDKLCRGCTASDRKLGERVTTLGPASSLLAAWFSASDGKLGEDLGTRLVVPTNNVR